MLLDDKGELILCADCLKSGMYVGFSEDHSAPQPKRSKTDSKAKPVAPPSSSSHTTAAEVKKKKPPPSGSSARLMAPHPQVSKEATQLVQPHEGLLGWCISKYYEARGGASYSNALAASTATAAVPTTEITSQQPSSSSSSLDTLLGELPPEVLAHITGQPLKRAIVPKSKSRKGIKPRKITVDGPSP
jgi:hypothetical protein